MALRWLLCSLVLGFSVVKGSPGEISLPCHEIKEPIDLSFLQDLANPPQNCIAPVLQNGFFFAEQDMAHGTNLYYGCNVNFKPVAEAWWGTVTCSNGTWSPEPQCIESSACLDPEIPNASYDKSKYYNHHDVLRIKCNPGYEANNNGATGCRNGEWEPALKCEVMESSCEPPPELPNAVVVNQDFQDMFPDSTTVTYMCKSGFDLETLNNWTVCSNGKWLEPYPSCKQEEVNPPPVPPVSTGASAVNSGSSNYQPMITSTDQCGPAPVVKNGVSRYQSDTSLRYECISLTWYKLKGNRIVRCMNGEWTPAPTCEDNFCKLDTSRLSHLENINEFMKPGEERWVGCPYYTLKWARAVCIENQLWISNCCGQLTHGRGTCGFNKITPSQ